MLKTFKMADQTAAGQVIDRQRVKNKGIKRRSKVPGVMITQYLEQLPEGKTTPDFTRKPIALTIQEGKLAIFKAIVTGDPEPVVTWNKADGDITDTENYQIKFDPIKHEHTLEMPTVTTDQAGSYKCYATNEYGKAVCPVNLNVIEVGFKKMKAMQDARAAAAKEPQDFRKMLKKRAVGEAEGKKEGEPDEKVWEILMSADKKDFERICMEYGITDFRGMLKRLNEMKREREEEQAEFIEHIGNLKHIEVKAEDMASFELDMELKDPNSRIFLYKDGVMVPYSQEMDEEMKHNLKQIGKKYVFTINSLLPEDAGLYQVDVEGVNIFSTDFKIPSVDFVVKIQEVKAEEREDAIFQCVLSQPITEILWISKNVPLKTGEKYDITVSEDKLIHKLVVKDCLPLDTGIYAAVAGINSCNAWLVVEADKDPATHGKKKARKTTQAGGGGEDLKKIAREQEEKYKKDMEEKLKAAKKAKAEREAAEAAAAAESAAAAAAAAANKAAGDKTAADKAATDKTAAAAAAKKAVATKTAADKAAADKSAAEKAAAAAAAGGTGASQQDVTAGAGTAGATGKGLEGAGAGGVGGAKGAAGAKGAGGKGAAKGGAGGKQGGAGAGDAGAGGGAAGDAGGAGADGGGAGGAGDAGAGGAGGGAGDAGAGGAGGGAGDAGGGAGGAGDGAGGAGGGAGGAGGGAGGDGSGGPGKGDDGKGGDEGKGGDGSGGDEKDAKDKKEKTEEQPSQDGTDPNAQQGQAEAGTGEAEGTKKEPLVPETVAGETNNESTADPNTKIGQAGAGGPGGAVGDDAASGSAEAAGPEGASGHTRQGPVLPDTVSDPGVHFASGLEDVKAILGSAAELICKLSSEDCEGVWSKDGNELSSSEGITIAKDGAVHKLTIHKITEDNAGKYRFEAEGRKTESVIIVEDPPRFKEDELTEYTKPVTVKNGQNGAFKIRYVGGDPMKVQWYKDGEELAEQANIKIEKTEGHTYLLLRKLHRKDSGEIKIKIKNEFGAMEAITQLIVLDKPMPPQGPVEVIEGSANCIEIKWRPPKDDGGSKVTHYNMERQQVGRNTWKKIGDIPGDPQSYKDTNVDHGRRYCYRIKAITAEGVSDLMETEDIQAGTKAYPGPPSAPKVVSAFKECINLSWTGPTNTGGTSILGYTLEKRKKGSNLWSTVNPAEELIKENAYEVKDVIEGLQYEFRLSAINFSGAGESSTPSEFVYARDPKKPPGKVNDLKVTDSNYDILCLAWTKPRETVGVQDEAKGFFVEIRPAENPEWHRCNTNPISMTSYTVKGLKSMAMYWARVIATNDGGEGEPQDLDTYVLAMPPPVRPRFTDAKMNSFMVVRAGNSARVNINFEASPWPEVIWLKDGVPVGKRVTISNAEGASQLLLPTSERSDTGVYTIIVKNIVGQETFSVEIRVTDEPKPPGPVELEENVRGTVTLSWTESPDEKRDDRLHYMVSKRDSIKQTWNTVADRLFNNKFTACNILPGREYYFRVYAKNDMGQSKPSESATWAVFKKKEKFTVNIPESKTCNFERPPKFMIPLKLHTAPEGYECYMTCAVRGDPAPRITWYRDNISINTNTNYLITNTCGVCSMLILRVGTKDMGEYKITAENPLGRAECSTKLAVRE
ncbi:hypothetical protein AAFF_G00033420 [Aldrovandia affinis]|uniref:Immunoglobulin-like and fibronectin type III domain-containing protein 1 n=1 Tax=Aldrovandia affinis TaxID=143900 RepID=A0AAD7S3L2_9TELE|nr:hypothetical protein AAFF_G00033420 [Aldrovandia affinis]